MKKKKADLVIFYDGVNDVNFLCDSTISIPGHRRENQFKQKLMTQKGTQNYFNANDNILGLGKQIGYLIFLKNTFIVINLAFGNYITKTPHFPYTCHLDDDRANQVAENILGCWKIARKIAQENGSDFIAILQPNIYIGNAKRDYLKPERSGLQSENFQSVYRILKEKINQENQDWIFDFSNILDNTVDPLYFDFCHLNGDGNQIIANQICEIVNNIPK